jgi:hypothetical protein
VSEPCDRGDGRERKPNPFFSFPILNYKQNSKTHPNGLHTHSLDYNVHAPGTPYRIGDEHSLLWTLPLPNLFPLLTALLHKPSG